jgi:hypothetical protein
LRMIELHIGSRQRARVDAPQLYLEQSFQVETLSLADKIAQGSAITASMRIRGVLPKVVDRDGMKKAAYPSA